MEAAAIGNQVGDGATDDGKGGVEHGEDGEHVEHGEDGEEDQDSEHFSLRGEGVVQNVNQKFVQEWEKDALVLPLTDDDDYDDDNDDDDDDDDKLIMRQRSDYDETLRRSKMKLPRTLSKLLIESPRLPSLE